MSKLVTLLFLSFQWCVAAAQPPQQPVEVRVIPDRSNWQANTGEPVRFTIGAYRAGQPLRNAKLRYEVGPERMSPLFQDSTVTGGDPVQTKALTLKEPGFLRCIATVEWEGRTYRNLATVGMSIGAIRPTVSEPADFDAFWSKAKAELAAIPLDAKMTLLPERSSALTKVYQVSAQNIGTSKLYGILCIPKKAGKYPAVLQVPGAGVRPYGPDLELADRGLIVFSIGIHGIPVTMDPGVYRDLGEGALRGYFFFNADHRDRFYYKRVYLGCIRANDLIASLPEFNGHLGVSGNSQGGALSIVTAALDPRVGALAAIHPALCDLTGYLQGRAGGWPHFFGGQNLALFNNDAVKATLLYYDVVNFAKRLNVPGWYTWGFNDETCPPTSMYAAYNSVSSPKQTALFVETGHWFYPEQRSQMNNWLIGVLKN